MNLDKKRKRQAGRQARKVQDHYSIWIDDAGKVHAKRYKARNPWAKMHKEIDPLVAEGKLPRVDFNPVRVVTL